MLSPLRDVCGKFTYASLWIRQGELIISLIYKDTYFRAVECLLSNDDKVVLSSANMITIMLLFFSHNLYKNKLG